MLVTLAIEHDAPLADTLTNQVDTLVFETFPKEARHIPKSTIDKSIKHSSKRFSYAQTSNWKQILTGHKNKWMPVSYSKSMNQSNSSYGEFIEDEVHYLQTTLPVAIAMMGFENSFNLIETKPRPPPSPNILVSSLTDLSLQVCPKISNFEKGSTKLVDDQTWKYQKSLEMIDEHTSDSRNSILPWQADSDSKMYLQHLMSTLPQPAPNIWIVERERVITDGESFCAHHHRLQGYLNWLKEAPNYGERMSPYALVNLSSCSKCLGNSFPSPWREKKVYTAHIGWENGENISHSFQGDIIEQSFIQSDYQSALVDVIR
jgi:hypothetical protein